MACYHCLPDTFTSPNYKGVTVKAQGRGLIWSLHWLKASKQKNPFGIVLGVKEVLHFSPSDIFRDLCSCNVCSLLGELFPESHFTMIQLLRQAREGQKCPGSKDHFQQLQRNCRQGIQSSLVSTQDPALQKYCGETALNINEAIPQSKEIISVLTVDFHKRPLGAPEGLIHHINGAVQLHLHPIKIALFYSRCQAAKV